MKRRTLPTWLTRPMEFPDEFVWAPKGAHHLRGIVRDGERWSGMLVVDADSFAAVSASFRNAKAKRKKLIIDVNHEEDGPPAADVLGFSWCSRRGIIVRVRWRPWGQFAIRARIFRSFSPTFSTCRRTGRIAGLLDGCASVGGLVKASGFGDAMPLVRGRISR